MDDDDEMVPFSVFSVQLTIRVLGIASEIPASSIRVGPPLFPEPVVALPPPAAECFTSCFPNESHPKPPKQFLGQKYLLWRKEAIRIRKAVNIFVI